MTRSRRITVHDVAARAGVSQPTVSLVLSRNPKARIAPETRERVLRAAEELGYRTNLLARGLTQQRSWALGLVVPDLRNPFFADVVAGAERVATEEGYALLLTEAGEEGGGAARRVEALQARLVDGVIIDAVGAAALPKLLLEKLNVVLIDEPSERWPGVASDAAGAGRLAAEHLLALGHRHIGFIGPATDVHGVRLRERGFVQALREHGLRLDSGVLRRAPGTAAGGREAMRALLALRERPTAVFCSNDLVAVGALKACADAGVVVPRDCSVVGCDDIEMARFVSPELTTVAIPARELGARAARLLIRRLAEGTTGGAAPTHRATPAPMPVRPLPVKLMVRRSSARPPVAAA